MFDGKTGGVNVGLMGKLRWRSMYDKEVKGILQFTGDDGSKSIKTKESLKRGESKILNLVKKKESTQI